ncbi:hypothetical protein [Paraflavitalea speifideaquila]|uniref:hypothetical protein n=1 Tax=Paraflavitalea speifideaquila TaxID=3076558 RepID=UPI0028E6EC46|nr:hypothetical protein [Paraflavitalea speifideiaquila]
MPRKMQLGFLLAGVVAFIWVMLIKTNIPGQEDNKPVSTAMPEWPWEAPDTASIPVTAEGELIRYGRSLIANTARYLGPRGKYRPFPMG